MTIRTQGGKYDHFLRATGKPAVETIPDASKFTGVAADYGMEVVPLGA